ncbi:MAG: ABC transporter permease [Actinobacteria bacterium]|nr:ABC transporter permease [Actinomycetota bacterium]MDQ3162081.1 ABC transporter permease [Actinomycetota bacterium]
MRLRLLFSESVRSLAANLSTTVAATMTVLIGMFLLGLFVALGSWVVSWSDHVKRELVVKAFFVPEAEEAQFNSVRRLLAADTVGADAKIKSFQFISKGEALERMRKQFPDFTSDLTSNPLPAAYEIVPKRGEDVEAIATSLKPLPAGLDKVTYGKQTADRILRVARVIEIVFLAAVLVLLAASTLLIANTIRLSIFSRRREIEVMKLVGATNWFVRGPFMLEGLLCGLAGAVAAIFLLLLGKELALPAILGRIESSSDVQALAFSLNAAILIGVGLTIGAIGSGLTLRRFLNV